MSSNYLCNCLSVWKLLTWVKPEAVWSSLVLDIWAPPFRATVSATDMWMPGAGWSHNVLQHHYAMPLHFYTTVILLRPSLKLSVWRLFNEGLLGLTSFFVTPPPPPIFLHWRWLTFHLFKQDAWISLSVFQKHLSITQPSSTLET